MRLLALLALVAALRPAASGSIGLIGVSGDGFVVVAAGTASLRGSMVLSKGADPVWTLPGGTLAAFAGDDAAGPRLAERLTAEARLKAAREPAPPSARMLAARAARLARGTGVEAIIGGPRGGGGTGAPGLYRVGQDGGLYDVRYAASGAVAAMAYSALDECPAGRMTEAEAVEAVRRCADVVAQRMAFDVEFLVKVSDKDGPPRTVGVVRGRYRPRRG